MERVFAPSTEKVTFTQKKKKNTTTEPSKTSSTKITTQNQPEEKDKEETTSTEGFFDNFIEKKLSQKLDLSSKDTGSNEKQD